MQQLEEKISQIFAPIIEALEIDFIDLEIHGFPKNPVVKVFVDIPGGIKIEKCASLSKDLNDVLEIADIMTKSYRLEVSSPGLDRPLKTGRDFFRNVGRHVKITRADGEEGTSTIIGEILDIENDVLSLRLENREIEAIPIEVIKKAVLQIKWK